MSLATPTAGAQTSPLFEAPEVIANEFRRFELVLDLDGNGFKDAMGWWREGTDRSEITLRGWRNDGTGNLIPTWSKLLDLPLGTPSFYASAKGDFNRDLRQDFVLCFDQTLYIYHSNGTSSPTLAGTLRPPTTPTDVLVEDFNDDGHVDLATRDSFNVAIYLNDGTGVSWSQSDYFRAIGSDHFASIRDANQDGLPDIVIPRGTLIDIYTVVDGVNTDVATVAHDLGSSEMIVVACADIDRDFDHDIVVFRNDNGQCAVIRQNAGAFTAEPSYAGGPATDLADVNGDGYVDGVCCGGGGDGRTRNVWQSFFEIALNDGTGHFAPSFQIETIGSHHIAGVADLDADGDADLVAGRSVLMGYGPLGEAHHLSYSENDIAASEIVDFDNDGDLDLSIGEDRGHKSLADGSFESTSITLPPPPEGMFWEGPGIPGDFDGDGDTDILISLASGVEFLPTFEELRLFVNNGAGALFDVGPASGPGVDLGVSDDPKKVLIVDVDDDGDLDVVDRFSINTIYLNDGSGFFVVGQNLEPVKGFADLNGDNITDVVVASSTLKIRLGLGDGTFGSLQDLGTPLNDSDRIGIDDLDDDGDTDLVMVSDATLRIVLHLNDGTGSFTPDTNTLSSHSFHENASVRGCFLVDVNDDSALDIVAWPVDQASNVSYVILQATDHSSFDDPRQFVFTPENFADVDGDGDPDAFTDRIFFNRTYDQPDAGLVQQYGRGSQDSCSVEPVLGATGPFRVGHTMSLRMSGLEPGSLGIFTVGLSPSELDNLPWDGVTAYNWPWSAFFIIPALGGGSLPGDASVQFPFLVDAGLPLAGPLYHQAFFSSPCTQSGFQATNGLLIIYRP